MGKVDKSRVMETFARYLDNMSEIYKTDDEVYDLCLKMTLPGNPVSDSRPRATKNMTFYNPHKEALKKLFRPIYNEDGTLKHIILDKICKVTIKVFYYPTKSLMKNLGYENVASEKFPSIIVKDNDNIEKVHWDVLHDWEFKVLLDDNLIVDNHTSKRLSIDERTEIYIEFCSDNDNVHPAYDMEIKSGLKYKYMFVHPKFLSINKLYDDVDFLNYFFNRTVIHFKLQKKTTFKKTLRKTLEKLPVSFIQMAYTGLFNKPAGKATKDTLITLYLDKIVKVDLTSLDYKYLDQANKLFNGGLTNEYIKSYVSS